MQVLYQLSYGPMGGLANRTLVDRLGPWTLALAPEELTTQRFTPTAEDGPLGCAQTWRQTATIRPWTVTWSASSSIGA